MTALLKKVAVFIMYVGKKLEKPDTTRAATGLVWYGNGFVHLVDEEAALLLVAHPDVWAPVEQGGVEIPPRVQAAYNAAYRKMFGRMPLDPAPIPGDSTIGLAEAAKNAAKLKPVDPPAPPAGTPAQDEDQPEELNFDDDDLNFENQQEPDAESPRMQAIRSVLMSLDVTKPNNRNPDFFNQDGSPKIKKVRELMNDDGVTKEEVAEALAGIMSEMTPV